MAFNPELVKVGVVATLALASVLARSSVAQEFGANPPPGVIVLQSPQASRPAGGRSTTADPLDIEIPPGETPPLTSATDNGKKSGKYDISTIGNRQAGHGLNVYVLEREQRMGQHQASKLEAQVKLVGDPLVNDYVNQFSLTPTDLSVAGRKVTVGFELQLVGTHSDLGSVPEESCNQCHQVLLSLLDLADGAVATRASGPSGRDRGCEKLTRFRAGIGCDRKVRLVVRLLQTRRFEQTKDGWALEFLQQVRLSLLEKGCRQIELPEETETGLGTPPADRAFSTLCRLTANQSCLHSRVRRCE